MIKQTFQITLLTSSGVSETQLQKIILEELAQYGLHDAEISISETSERPCVFGADFHLENGETLLALRKWEKGSRS